LDDSRFQQLFNFTANLSVVFQVAGTLLVAASSCVVSRSLRYRLMYYWSYGWACYAVALACVFIMSAPNERIGAIGMFAYFFLEYAAVLLIFAACRLTASDEPPSGRFWILLVPAAMTAAGLCGPPSTFFPRYAVHTAILGCLWASCLIALWPALKRTDSGPGVRMLAVGLVLLSLDYLHHLPVALYMGTHHLVLSAYYYTAVAAVDTLLEFVLGFGTVVVIVDKVRADLARANVRLETARELTEEALHTDSLTQVLSRYSFAASFGEERKRGIKRGCVIMVDLDDLKRINDELGHAAGDAAIRSVSRGLRILIRQGDSVYRWGGDEFVVVMPEIPLALAQARMAQLDKAINQGDEPVEASIGPLTVSWGAAAFDDAISIKTAIAAADANMYAAKSARKNQETS
jgi:diguanylate cyclase (GGDEF)-like protein